MERPSAAVAEVLDAVPLAVVVVDDELRVTAWNAAAEVLYGHRRDEAVGASAVELLFDDDDRASAGLLWREVAASSVWDGDRRVRRSDGMLLVSSFRAIPTAGGGLAWIATDGMDQGLAEQERGILLSAEHAARRTAEEALGLVEAIITSAPVGIAVFDLALNYARVNEAYAALSGARPADHVGRSLDDVSAFPADFGADLRRVVTTGRTILGRSLQLHDGEDRYFTVGYYPVRTSTGVLVGAGATVVDVTETKVAEAERAELLRRAEAAQQRLAVLATASTVLTSTMDVDELLTRLARVLAPGAADWCVIQLLSEDGGVEHVAVSHRNHTAAADLRTHLGENPVAGAEVLRSGQAMVLGPGALQTERFVLQSSVVVPIETHGQRIGVLVLSTDDEHAFGDDDVDLAVEVAHRAALAVGNARAYQHEHQIAESLQRALLPNSVPSVEGVDFTVRYLAATNGVSVGGDWYDVIEFGDGQLGVVVGDVVGHDIAASTTMGQVRSVLRAFACEDHAEPSRAVARLDKLFGPLALPSATCIFGVLDLAAMEFRWSNAGHPPPLLLRDGGASYLEEGNGIILGVIDGTGAREASVELRDGDVLMLYTDGLVERRGESLTVGLDRLAARAAGLVATSSGEALCDRLLDAMLPPSTAREDDVAILVIGIGSRVGGPLVHRITLDAEPSSPGVARGFAAGILSGAGWSDHRDTVVLLVSELVTNALHHGTAPCSLGMTFRSEDELEVWVEDADVRGPSRQDPDDMAEHGRGLLLVEALANEWGVRPQPAGKQVWFRLRR